MRRAFILTNPSEKDIDQITELVYSEFPEWWTEDETRRAMSRSCTSSVPCTAVVKEDDEIIAVGQLQPYDLYTRPDLYPWIANVVVRKDHRGEGLLCDIMSCLIDKCRDLKIENVYLYTSHNNLYERFGFEHINDEMTRDGHHKVYRKKLH